MKVRCGFDVRLMGKWRLNVASSDKAIYAALAGNAAVAATKMVAAIVTGSSAMLSESIHSVVDTADEGLLLLA